MRNQSQRNALFAALSTENDTNITLAVLSVRVANSVADCISTVASTVVQETTVFTASCILAQKAINAGMSFNDYVTREAKKAELRKQLADLD